RDPVHPLGPGASDRPACRARATSCAGERRAQRVIPPPIPSVRLDRKRALMTGAMRGDSLIDGSSHTGLTGWPPTQRLCTAG
ncbi:MAG: hypothetical protein M3N26_10745, partial [Pseudomonadota bacterium]|nr:hypothetical protein [Pseudomonadota bacterium]